MRIIISLIGVLICCIACQNQEYNYQRQKNNYSFSNQNLINSTLISESLIYTYTTESLELAYTKIFCAGLKNCNYNISNIKNSKDFGYFDLDKKPILNNNLGIKTIYLYRILYTTYGEFGESRIVSGAIFVPDLALDKIKGTILFFHPTFFDKHSVPSYAAKASPDIALASIFVASGYILIAPDYIGMGYDDKIVHPYVLYPRTNVTDGLSMLFASKQFLTNFYQQSLPNKPLYITGYSEGGAYVLWFSRLYQEQISFRQLVDSLPFRLSKVVAISGAYNLSEVTYKYLFTTINFFNQAKYRVNNSIYAAALKPALLADALLSYAYYHESSNYNNVFNPEFFAMHCTWQSDSSCKFANKQVNLLEAFNQESDVVVVDKIYNAASFKLLRNYIFMNQINNVMPLINPKLLNNNNFMQQLRLGNVDYWHSTTPTTLITLKNDSVVSSYNTTFAYQGMLENKSTNLNRIIIDNQLIKSNPITWLPDFEVDHTNGLYYLYIAALNQFKQK